jgi:cell division protein FtsW
LENNIRQFRPKQNIAAQEPVKKELFYFDYTFLLVMIFLVGFGLVMVYSASYYEAMQEFNNPNYYVKKQAIAIALGFAGTYAAYKVPYKFYRKLGFLPYLACIVVILMIYPFGFEANGARRWIRLGPISFQAAEPVKLGMILFLANFVYAYRKKINTRKIIFMMIGLTLPIFAMVYKITDNLSSAIIIFAICIAMIFVATKDYKWFVGIGVTGVAAVIGLVWYIVQNVDSGGGFRSERILAWLDLEKYASGKGYQTLQALYAIGSGGIWGKGLCQSIQKLDFLPEAQNDMIFSIICEELGLFGGILVILMFMILIWRMVIIATHAADLQGAMIVVGVIAHIAVQVILNIAVVTNTIPNTGISLPFISYGGTSICFLMVEMGVVMNVARNIKITNY